MLNMANIAAFDGIFGIHTLLARRSKLLGTMATSGTHNTFMLIGILVIDEQLTMFAVPARLLPSNTDHVKDGGCLVENDVHLFERSAGSFGKEEVSYGDDDEVAVC